MIPDFENLSLLATTVRMLSVDIVERANSGHPGMPMGAADYTSLLWSRYLNFNPSDPQWINRDRFVLSAGHGSALLYSLLHLFGYNLPLSELQNFRQWGSRTPGHPEFGHTPGVETTTGPLGAGFANGVGIALSGKLLARAYSPELFNYRVFGVVSDGDLMEGVASEAASLAGHLGLGNLTYIYDSNHISIGGDTKVCFTESVAERFAAYGWHVQNTDGHDFEELERCFDAAIAEKSKPSIIIARTRIGQGSPNRVGSADVHGTPLGKDEIAATRRALGWPLDKDFYVPDAVRDHCARQVEEKQKAFTGWQKEYQGWRAAQPDLATKLDAQLARRTPAALKDELVSVFSASKKDATRNLSGQVIQVIAKHLPYFVGGSADLEPSNKTLIKNTMDIGTQEFSGRNIRFGIREHAMGSIVNGLAYTGMWIPFGATFLVFSDYMRPAIRLAAISRIQSLFIFTHDSFWVGEDGPTHQPIEHIASLRLIPGLNVFRPADGLETAMCYWQALQIKDAPSTLMLTRQNLTPLEHPAGFSPDEILAGAYVLSGAEITDFVIVASGSEVGLAVLAAKELAAAGKSPRVVSMPCMEVFLRQPQTYRDSVLPPASKKVSIEAGSTATWERVLGNGPALKIGIDHFGASAPGEVLAEKFGFTAKGVMERIRSWEAVG